MSWSIRNTFLLPTVLIIAIGMLVSSTLLFMVTKSVIEGHMFDRLNSTTSITSNQLGNWLKDRRLDIETWSTQSVFQTSVKGGFVAKAAQKKASETLKHWLKEYGYYNALYLVDKNGAIVASSLDSSILPDSSYLSQDVLSAAMQGQFSQSEVLTSPVTQTLGKQLMAPVTVRNEVVGVLVGELNMDYVHKFIMAPIKIGDRGYAFLINESGQMLSHPKSELIGGYNVSDAEFGQAMLTNDQGSDYFKIDGMDTELSYTKVEGESLVIGVAVSLEEVDASAYQILMTNFAISLAVIGVVTIVIFFITNTVTKPINAVVNELEEIAKGGGDLTVRLDTEGSKEVKRLATGFNGFVSNVRELVIQVKSDTHSLTGMMQDLSTTTSDLVSSNDSIARRSDALAASAEQMTLTVADVARNAEAAGESSAAARNVAQESVLALEDVVSAINRMAEVIEHAGSQVHGLADRLDGMTDLVKAIEGIAEQTNLLALNAAIEAARAGEHGRGFAVVADEVRNLAKKTVDATSEITHFINNIHQDTEQALDAVKQGQEEAGRSHELRDNASQAISEIDKQIVQISTQAMDIAEATSQLNTAIQEIVSNIETVATGNTQNSQNVTSIGSTIESAVTQTDNLGEKTLQFKT
jgi:methyl-accepting chemotaxis protein